MQTMETSRRPSSEAGFSLLEILVALTILAVGSVSVIALFAAAVQLQYKSAIEDQVGLLLPEIEARAQEVVNDFEYEESDPVPPDLPPEADGWEDAPDSSGYRYRVRFMAADAGLALPGEGYWIDVKVKPPGGGREIEFPRMWFLKRQLFSERELEESVTWEQEREGEADRDAREGRDEVDDR
jgi:prepilin-type N-terminal cleavage/methylation domain-containing protein